MVVHAVLCGYDPATVRSLHRKELAGFFHIYAINKRFNTMKAILKVPQIEKYKTRFRYLTMNMSCDENEGMSTIERWNSVKEGDRESVPSIIQTKPKICAMWYIIQQSSETKWGRET